MSEDYLGKPKGYSIEALFNAKKKGIWLTVEPNIGFKLATLTPSGEEYLKHWDMSLVFIPKNQPREEQE